MGSPLPTAPRGGAARTRLPAGKRLAQTSLMLPFVPIGFAILLGLVNVFFVLPPTDFQVEFFGLPILFAVGAMASLSAISLGLFAMFWLPQSSAWNGAAVAGIALGALELLAIYYAAALARGLS